jgi:hypothetical protein
MASNKFVFCEEAKVRRLPLGEILAELEERLESVSNGFQA